MIEGVIFDADGTLIDSMPFWTSTVYDIIRIAGIEPSDDLIDLLNPMSMAEGARYLHDNIGIEMSVDEIIEQENARVLEFYQNEVEMLPNMRELLDCLSAHGIPMVIASATESALIKAALAHTGITDKFKAVLSCSDVGHGKDKPDVFLKACGILGLSPGKTAVVEDSPTARETARRAGFVVVDAQRYIEAANNSPDKLNTFFDMT